MKILVTGAKGFIGKNLISTLNNIRTGKDKTFKLDEDIIIYEYDIDTSEELLNVYCKDCDFVFNLAGVNRPKEQGDFMDGNFGFASKLLDVLKSHENCAPVMLSSSIQAELDNPYGKSKKAGEELFISYGQEMGAPVYIFRFPNVFGKWCRPNYNSAIATFCHNIANGEPIQVNDRNTELQLVYVDDVVKQLILALNGELKKDKKGFSYVSPVHVVKLGEIVDLLYNFRDSRENLSIPNMTKDGFAKKLYSTYLSYLPKDSFAYTLKMNVDSRGSFTEIIKTLDRGQISVNISKPGITKGNHWHHTKTEKFVVVSGKGLIQFREIDSEEIIEYHVSGETIEVVDIPTGYTHNIINEGETDLVTFMWCNECFDPEQPDTYFLEV